MYTAFTAIIRTGKSRFFVLQGRELGFGCPWGSLNIEIGSQPLIVRSPSVASQISIRSVVGSTDSFAPWLLSVSLPCEAWRCSLPP